MNRRFFIKSGGVALASFGLMNVAPSFCNAPSWGRRVIESLAAAAKRLSLFFSAARLTV